MRILPIDPIKPDAGTVERAADVLRHGGVLLYPTDTCYGLGVDARNVHALQRLTELKGGREAAKRYSVIARDLAHIEQLTNVTQVQRTILQHYLPGPYTFILLNSDFTVAQTSTLGVRWPDYAPTQALSNELNDAYVTTSVNLTGQKPIYDIQHLEAEFLEQTDPRLWPDLVLDAGPLPERPSSTVVDLTTDIPTVLRNGPMPFAWPLPQN